MKSSLNSHAFFSKAKLILEATFFIIIFTISEVDIQVQNGQEVLGSLVLSILDMEPAYWGSMAILDLYIYLVQVSKNDDEERCFLK